MENKEKIETLKQLLKDENIYNLVTALRGCDFYSPSLKRIFTARIRYLLGIEYPHVAVRKTPKIKDSRLLRAILDVYEIKDCRMLYHYLGHVHSALDCLRQYNAIDRLEYEFLHDLRIFFETLAYDVDFNGRKLDVNEIRETIKNFKAMYPELIDSVIIDLDTFVASELELRGMNKQH